jgi:hypothetical protein
LPNQVRSSPSKAHPAPKSSAPIGKTPKKILKELDNCFHFSLLRALRALTARAYTPD